MSSSSKIDNRKKDILILGKGPTQGVVIAAVIVIILVIHMQEFVHLIL